MLRWLLQDLDCDGIARAAFVRNRQRILAFRQRIGNGECDGLPVRGCYGESSRADRQGFMRQKRNADNLDVSTRDNLYHLVMERGHGFSAVSNQGDDDWQWRQIDRYSF